MSLQTATGATLSSILTLEVHVAVLPLLSLTVKVTVTGLTLEQSKSVTSVSKLKLPQASVELLSTLSSAIVATPVADS